MTLGIIVAAIFFAPTALAVGSFVTFIFGGVFEIFMIRPLYLFALAAIKKCCLRRKRVDYKKLDSKESPLENLDLMDEANFYAAQIDQQPEPPEDAAAPRLISYSPPPLHNDLTHNAFLPATPSPPPMPPV